MAVKVLSLFDGMACGMLAMMAAGVEVESYDAYEIDKYAVKTATHNFPMIEQHGDVFKEDFTKYDGVDFLVGGSPCTYWSIAQTKNRETVASGMGWELFSQYVRALREAKPKYFIYENNKSMSKEIRASIDEAFGFEAVCINSALVSAQNRQRLYWVGKRNADGTYSKVNVEQPEDRGILLKDIIDITADREWHDMPRVSAKKNYVQFDVSGKGYNSQQDRAHYIDGKFGCLPSARSNTKIKVCVRGSDKYTNLTLDEAKKLQTVPDWYEMPMYNGKANISLIQLGNGWTVEVIAHLIRSALCGTVDPQTTLF